MPPFFLFRDEEKVDIGVFSQEEKELDPVEFMVFLVAHESGFFQGELEVGADEAGLEKRLEKVTGDVVEKDATQACDEKRGDSEDENPHQSEPKSGGDVEPFAKKSEEKRGK